MESARREAGCCTTTVLEHLVRQEALPPRHCTVAAVDRGYTVVAEGLSGRMANLATALEEGSLAGGQQVVLLGDAQDPLGKSRSTRSCTR